MKIDDLKSERLTYGDTLEEVWDDLYAKGCNDGLPIVPPTPERVRDMIAFNNLDPQQVIAEKVPPRNGIATVEKIAINAVMAGCRPEYLPVVIAAVEAMTAEGFDLFGVQATTHPCGMIVFINGPIRKQLEINCESGAMGPGWRANATIGRAIRLVMLNLGGAAPGSVDKSTQGTPAKYTFCFGENEEQSPWEPFHVARGFKPTDSTVTVLGLEGPQDINGQDATRAESFLRILASSLLSPGTSNFRFTTGSDLWIFLGPEHAAILGRDGVTREQVKEYLFETCRVPLDLVSQEHLQRRVQVPAQHGQWDGKSPIPIVKDKNNILISIVGGAGLHSSWSPSWGGPRHQAVTKLIRVPERMPAQRTEDYDLLVIGQGYAGLTMAKIANEKGLRTANFESKSMGGLIVNLNELAPAPPGDGETGSEVVASLAMHNMDNGVDAISDAVTSLARGDDGRWVVKTESKAYAAADVVVASGARLRALGVPGETEFAGHGVHECVHCDGSLFQGMETVIIGGGDSAFQEAVALAHYASKVTMIMDGKPTARADLRKPVDATKNIVQLTNTRVVAINGAAGNKVESVRVAGPKGERDLPCAGVFTFIGLEPNTGFLPAEVQRDAAGAVIADANGKTSLPGLWAIGAVRSGFPGLLKDASDEASRVLAALAAGVKA